MLLPQTGAFLFSIVTTVCCLAGPVLPATVSEEARAFLEIAVPADLSQPETVEDWQILRAEMAQTYDSSATVMLRYPFKTTETRIGGVENLIFEAINTAKPVTDRVVMHLHGGAYVVGAPQVDSVLIAPVAHMTGLKVIAVNYRLAPEHPYPAVLEDVVSVYADYSNGFPRTLIQVGTRDLFLSNCARLQRKMVADGVSVEMSLWEGMWHSFQMNPDLPEAHEALRELAGFVSSALKHE